MPKPETILVCGGRTFGALPNKELEPELFLERFAQYEFGMKTLSALCFDWAQTPKDAYGNWLPAVTIISGGATGADTLAIDWAVVNWCNLRVFKAEWKTYGRKAGPIRNKKMLLEGKPDEVVAFPGGRGTAHMIKLSKEAGVPVREIEYNVK